MSEYDALLDEPPKSEYDSLLEDSPASEYDALLEPESAPVQPKEPKRSAFPLPVSAAKMEMEAAKAYNESPIANEPLLKIPDAPVRAEDPMAIKLRNAGYNTLTGFVEALTSPKGMASILNPIYGAMTIAEMPVPLSQEVAKSLDTPAGSPERVQATTNVLGGMAMLGLGARAARPKTLKEALSPVLDRNWDSSVAGPQPEAFANARDFLTALRKWNSTATTEQMMARSEALQDKPLHPFETVEPSVPVSPEAMEAPGIPKVNEEIISRSEGEVTPGGSPERSEVLGESTDAVPAVTEPEAGPGSVRAGVDETASTEPVFNYTAINPDGNETTGTIAAASANDAISALREDGYTPTSVAQAEPMVPGTTGLPKDFVSVGASTGADIPPPKITSTKNAVVDAERQSRGLSPIAQEARQSNPETFAQAEKALEVNPDHGKNVVNDLLSGAKREVSEVDEAVLLHEKITIQNERELAATRALDENLTPEERAEATARYADMESRLNDIDQATHRSGAIWGRLGQFRQRLMRDDYTFVAMERKARIAKGKPLTPEESTAIKLQSAELERTAKKAEEAIARADEEAAGGAVDQELQQIKARTKKVKPEDVAGERQRLLDGIKQRVAEGDSPKDLRTWIQRLAENIIKEYPNVQREPFIDRLHWEVSRVAPDLTRRQTMDLLSGYGDVKLLNPDQVKVKLRDLKGQLQQVAKIEDMMAKQPPKKTGVERRIPSDEERRLIKQVNELKKKGGFVVTDPAKQLKGALDAIKTRLRNQIADLDLQVSTKTKIVKGKSEIVYDAEANALKQQRDALKQQYDEVFGKPELTDAQRLKVAIGAAERAEKAWAERLEAAKKGTFDNKRPGRKITSAELEAIRKRTEAIRDEVKELHDTDAGVIAAKEVTRLESQQKLIEKQIADIQAKISSPDAPGAGPRVNRPAHPQLEPLLQQKDALRRQLAEARRSSEVLALRRYKTTLRRQMAEMEDRMVRGDFAKKPPKKRPELDAEALALKFENSKVKEQYLQKNLEFMLANRTLPKKFLDAGREMANTTRAIITSLDLSAVLRQGGFVSVAHPIRALKAFPSMFKALFSERGQHAVDAEIKSRENATNGLYQSSGLYLADDSVLSLSKMEENYMSRWLQKVPTSLGGGLIRGSQRAYITFLNRLRADSFDAMAKTLSRDGTLPTPEEAKAIANFVNVATGRGNLGANAKYAVGLNTVFFAPRYVLSRFQLLSAQPLWKGTAATRKLVATEYSRYLIGMGVVYGLAKAAGAEVEFDPRSSDFGKIKIGNTRLDPLSGLAQASVLASRLTTGETKKASGEIVPIRGDDVPFSGDSAAGVTGRFLRSKLSPSFGSAMDAIAGENVVGEPTTPLSAAQRMVTPLAFSDIKNTMEEQGVPAGTALGLVSLFGVGLQTYDNEETTVGDRQR